MNERLSRFVADWLAHPTGILQALATTVAWLASPWAFGWSEHTALFWYLGYCTFVSFATQFTIAYQARRNEVAAELALRNQMDLMRLLVALAKEIRGEQAEILEDLAKLEEQLE